MFLLKKKSTGNRLFIAMFTLFMLGMVSASSAQLYDVEVKLVRIKCLKVVEAPFDTEEDIFGSTYISAYRMKDANGRMQSVGCCFLGAGGQNYHFRFFTNVGNTPYKLGLNESRTFGTYYTFRGMTMTQLLSLEFGLGGNISDAELVPVRYQNCNECGDDYRLVRMSDFKSQFETLAAGASKLMKVGSDNIMELNFYEGDANSSHIQLQFNIKVTRK